MSDPTVSSAPPTHRVRTVNLSVASDNKIHDDATAAQYGFRGGLVPGTLMFAHMATPLAAQLGAAWLDGSDTELRLLQPAYDGEWLTVETGPAADDPTGRAFTASLRNEAGAELASLGTRLLRELPPVDERASMVPAEPGGSPVPVSWDALRLNTPLRALNWCPTRAEHDAWREAAGDDLALFREGAAPRIQPGKVLQGANDVFRHNFVLNPWIHTGSRLIQRAPLRLGDAVEIRAMPIEKWERKGHELVTLYVVFLNGGQPAVEVYHTAIFKVRRTDTAPSA